MAEFDIYDAFKYEDRYDISYTRIVIIEKWYPNQTNITSNFHYNMQMVINLIRHKQEDESGKYDPAIRISSTYIIRSVREVLEKLGCTCHPVGIEYLIEWPEGLEI
jgi:hypothetical protein